MKMLSVNRNLIVSIIAVMLLIYGGQSISYGQGKAPIITPGEINTTLKVSFRIFICPGSVKAYQVQFRRKDPQADWITKCDLFSSGGGGAGASWLSAIPGIGGTLATHFGGGGGDRCFYKTVYFSLTDLKPGTIYEARYRYTGLSECVNNPPNPEPWSPIVEGTTHLVTPPRVDFVDAILAKAVRKALDLDIAGGHIELLKIPQARLVELTELDYSRDDDQERFLNFRDEQIANLMGLEHATQLTKLYLGGNAISDITPLAQLTHLTDLDLGHDHASNIPIREGTVLDLGGNQIRDITPITNLTQLITLDLGGNQIRDISPLSQLTQLTELVLKNNEISNLVPLVQLTQLVKLDLGGNQIRDISPLSQLTQLIHLGLEGNEISDIAPLAQLTLTTLNLKNNQIKDIVPLGQWTEWGQLTELSLSRNQIIDITPLVQLAGSSVTKLDLSRNQINDVTPLAQLAGSSVTELDLRRNQIRDVAPLAALVQLEELSLRENPIENTYPLRALLDANPDLWIDIAISKEEVPTITASTPQPLTGITLDGAIVKLTLSSGAFHYDRILIRDALTITGIPGIGIIDEWHEIEILRDSGRKEIEIKLTFDGNNITTDTILTLTVGPRAIQNYNGPAYTLQIPVTTVSEAELEELSEALEASTDYPLTATTLDGATVTLRLTSGIYAWRYLIYKHLKISGIQGVTFGVVDDYRGEWEEDEVNRVSDTEITFQLAFGGTLNADTTLTFTLGPDAIASYDGPARTAEIPVSASTEVEVTGELIASTTVFPLSADTIDGSVVKLNLKTKSFQGFLNHENQVITSGIPGVSVERWTSSELHYNSDEYTAYKSKKEYHVLLSFSGNLDTDATLILSVPSRFIKDYKGPPISAEIPVAAKRVKQVHISEPSHWIYTDIEKIELTPGGSISRHEPVFQKRIGRTVDVREGKVYWFEQSGDGGTIKRANLDLTNIEVLATLPIDPYRVSIDTVGKRIYWINSSQREIQSAILSGENIQTVINLDSDTTNIAVDGDITDLAVVAGGSKLYWADKFSIWNVNPDGTNAKIVVTGWGTFYTKGISGITIAGGKIYWTGHQSPFGDNYSTIHRANLNGTGTEKLGFTYGVAASVAVDAIGGMVYWVNSLGGIQRMDINGGTVEAVVSGITAPEDFVVVTGVQQKTLTTPEIPVTTTPETSADTGVAVSISPASVVSPAVGEQLEVRLNIAEGEAVAGYQATVQFDTTALRYVSGTNGDFLPAGAFFVEPKAEGNLVKFNAVSLAGESSGDGTLATLTFEVIAPKASTLTLSDVLLSNSAGEKSLPQVENGQITAPSLNADVNGDGSVDLQDLAIVNARLGQTGENSADVNGDGVVDIADLALVAGAIENGAAAPSLQPQVLELFTAADVKQWLSEAQHLDLTDTTSQRGILFLQQLLIALTPKETALLANYPNPFNPETWIPYHLAKDANVTLHIYAVNGTLVRTLALGHQPAGMYQDRSRTAYWDGKNAFGESVASGVYFYTLTAGDFTATRKMLILK